MSTVEQKFRGLVRLANSDGASSAEQRTAALQAVRLVAKHNLVVGTWKIRKHRIESRRIQSIWGDIIELVCVDDNPGGADAIAKKLHAKASTVRAVLKQLVETGTLEIRGNGRTTSYRKGPGFYDFLGQMNEAQSELMSEVLGDM